MVGQTLHTRLLYNPKKEIFFLNFIYSQLYNSKLVKRYGHAPTDACRRYYKPDSCTHIAGKCPNRETLRINRHSAA